MIVRAAAADALVHVPRGDGELAAGSTVGLAPARLVAGSRAGSAVERAAARCSGARLRRRCASTSVRIVSRIGPRGGRSAALGYGA